MQMSQLQEVSVHFSQFRVGPVSSLPECVRKACSGDPASLAWNNIVFQSSLQNLFKSVINYSREWVQSMESHTGSLKKILLYVISRHWFSISWSLIPVGFCINRPFLQHRKWLFITFNIPTKLYFGYQHVRNCNWHLLKHWSVSLNVYNPVYIKAVTGIFHKMCNID